MDFIKFSIRNPVPVIVIVILVVLFGLIGLGTLPYQLSPTVTTPQISVTTVWSGATPYEVESEIIEEQEKVLKGIPGLTSLESQSYNNQGEITLEFKIGTNIEDALLRVSNKLNEVPDYPDNAEKPVISATGASSSPIVWLVLKTLPDNKRSIATYRTYFEEEVRQHLERINGVADLFVFGGTESEMHVVVDPQKLASYKLTIDSIISVLKSENVTVSAGTMGVGRRDFRIRTLGEFLSPADIENVVISSTGRKRLTIGDVAKVRYGYDTETVAMLSNGQNGIVCGIRPETGANVLEVTDQVEAVTNKLNDGQLKEQGLFFDWNYDQRPYINGAIDLVKKNILIGGALAIIVLLIFLQSISATVIVGIAIPISIIGTFMFLSLLGRNLNVVSLAGISFAVGMLVDNAIVVLENVDRHRKMGKKPFLAAYDGAKEVWGAVMASTATTVAVFLPVIFMEQEAGQLFKDIAIAVTSAILLSMFVSISVIPMMAKQLYTLSGVKKQRRSPLNWLGGRIRGLIMGILSLAMWKWFTRVATIGALTFLALWSAWQFFPKLEYLPQGNRNLLLNILIPPPGLSYKERLDIGKYIYSRLEPFEGKAEYEGMPGIANQFYVGADRIMLFGIISTQEQQAGRLIPYLSKLLFTIPGMYGVSIQAGIFQEGLGEGRNVDVDISGPNLDQIVGGAAAMFGALRQTIPNVQVRPVPSLELLYPEIKLLPVRDRVKSAGLSTESLGVAMDVLMDGRIIGDFKEASGKKIDLRIKAEGPRLDTPEKLYDELLVVPGGRLLPVSSLADLERTTGITQIRHLERQRTITLQVTPPPDMPLQSAMETIQNGLVPKLRNGPLKGLDVRLSGAADKLTETWDALQWNFLLALIITYLLMSALFGNFIYPFVILFTVPLAAAGGILGLKLQNMFVAPQSMDILTMLGFVILIGVVVNNAILIVHQSLNNIRYQGMAHREAVLDSVKTRIRPIFMSACTSIFGMLPLTLAPGPGSELYRGLGSVVLGGLAISTVFTVFLIPALLLFFIGMEKVPDKEGAD